MRTEAVLLVLLAAVLHAGWNLAMRRSQGDLAALWLSLALAGAGSLPFAAWFFLREPAPAVAWGYMTATGLIHALYFSLLARAYEEGEVSLVYPIARGTGVAGTAVLAMILGIDAFTPLTCLAVAAVVGGILVIGLGHAGRRQGAATRSVALALGVGTMVVAYSLCDKLAVVDRSGGLTGGALHPATYICAMFLGTAAFITPYVLVRSGGSRSGWLGAIRHSWRERKRYIVSIGPASLATYLLILYAFRLAPVSSVVALRESSVVIGSLLGLVFLKERMTVRKAAGLALIVAGAVLIKLGHVQS